ncbi:MAG TPA: hypothetical protein VGF32_02590 [Streptosporangiaceae bacterium]|jgi:threonine dehydratase
MQGLTCAIWMLMAASFGMTAVASVGSFAGRHVVTIVCGSNIDVDAYHRRIGAASVNKS